MKKPLHTSFLLVLAVTAAVAFNGRFQPDPPELRGSTILQAGDEFVYEVSWTWIKLGTIRLHTLPGRRAEAHIDSYEGLPFVDLHSVDFSLMDSLLFSRGSVSMQKQKSGWKGLNYLCDFPQHRVIIEEVLANDPAGEPYQRTPRDTIHLSNPSFVDGLSIAFFPRRFMQGISTLTIPTILYGKLGETTFNFTGNHTTESIDALDNPVRVVELTGNTTVVGIYGMTGDFKGWFSDDDAAVPIKGKLKVLIGNVTVELIQWNRKGWTPPQ